MAFDPDQYLSQQSSNGSKPSENKGFDPDAYLSSSQQEESKPTTGRSAASVGGEAFARGLPGTGGFLGAAGAASAFLAGPGLPAVAAISASTGPAAPFVAGAIEIGGPILAGMLGAYGVTSAVEKMNSILDPVGYAKWEQAKKEQPTAEMVGSFASGFAGSSFKTAPQLAGAGVSALKQTLSKPIAQRGVSGAAMGGLDAAQQYAQTGTVDPKMVAASAAGGFAMPGLNPAGRLAHGLGGASVNAFKKKTPSTPGSDMPERPPSDAPPEVKEKYIQELKERIKKRDETSPLTETAIRNKETGEVERMGPKHDQERKDATKDTHEEGFVDERGNFHERMDAIEQAKRSGQLPQDFVPKEPPPGERPGLHSGDLREAGDARFQVTKEQPAGQAKPEAPAFDPTTASREDYKKEIERLEDEFIKHDVNSIEAFNTGLHDEAKHLEGLGEEALNKANSYRQNMPPVKFANKAEPTWEEMHEHLWGVKTVGEALDRSLDAGLGTKSQQVLLKALSKFSGIRDASITFSKDLLKYKDAKGEEKQDANGLYYSTDHRVEMGKGGNLYVLLHESIHAGTSRLLHGGGKAAQALNDLYKKYDDIQQTRFDELRDKHQDVWDQVTSIPGIKISEIEPTFKEAIGYKDTYGFTDVHEFVAEAFTNRKFMKLLKDMDPVTQQPKGVIKNLWDEFKETVRTGLKIPKTARTALDEVLDAGTQALETQEKQFQAEKAEAARLSATPDYEPPQAPTGSSSTPMPSKETDKFIERQISLLLEDQKISEGEAVDMYRRAGAHSKADKLEAKIDRDNYLVTKFDKYGIDSLSDAEVLEYYNLEKASKEKILEKAKERDAVADFFEKKSQQANTPQRAKETKEISDRHRDSANRLLKLAIAKDAKPSAKPSTGSDSVDEAIHGIDVRTIPNKEQFYEHATDILEKHGEEVAIKFLEDYRTEVNKRQIPIPEDLKGLDDMFHKMDTWSLADESERVMYSKEAKEAGVTKEMLEQWFFDREDGKTSPEMEKWLAKGDSELTALVKKAQGMGLDIGEEFTKGQSRIRIQGGVSSNWKQAITEFFANRTPMGEKIAEKADAAHERKVFGIEGTDRVVEIHRVDKDQTLRYKEGGIWKTKEVKRGTEIYEWRDGKKTKIGHSDDLKLSPKSESNLIKTLDGKDTFKIGDARVQDIETHSPYRYLHDAMASQSLAIMGLRKYIRDAEAMQKLTESPLFKEIGHGPTEDLKTLPKGWVVPASIDRIPQLRGWHFDPKAAAIVEDFAKVWDNNLLLKLTNQLVKNMMLNPIPHMFNEAMHLWNARGLSGWVNPLKVGSFVKSGSKAFDDVMQQTDFYRQVMREGGSILGASARNNYFTELIQTAGKQLKENSETNAAMIKYAKKMGTPILDAYSGLSKTSQKAMWVTRDVMYMQLIHEVMGNHLKETGKPMELKAAIDKVERHMPNYRMPSEVLGSRSVAKVLKNPNLTVFSRYHYGMAKSLINTVKDINPRNLSTPEGRKTFKEGADTMLAIGVAMGVLYPLMDAFAQAIFGEGAEQRRAGPYHLIKAGVDVAEGKKDMSALLWPVLSFNPAFAILGQLALNKKIFSGKNIYQKSDSAAEITHDIAVYMGSQVPQVPPIMGAVNEEGGTESLIAKQLDIKAQTPEQRRVAARALKREETARKSRETKRAKGTYKP